jgi:hypothetical protein
MSALYPILLVSIDKSKSMLNISTYFERFVRSCFDIDVIYISVTFISIGIVAYVGLFNRWSFKLALRMIITSLLTQVLFFGVEYIWTSMTTHGVFLTFAEYWAIIIISISWGVALCDDVLFRFGALR